MITITINIENGNEASEACREVARMIDNGYTSGMIGCSGDTFEIEGDIFSDEEEDDEFVPTESGKTEVRIEAVKDHCYPSAYLGDAVYIHHTCALQSCSVKIMVIVIRPPTISHWFSM